MLAASTARFRNATYITGDAHPAPRRYSRVEPSRASRAKPSTEIARAGGDGGSGGDLLYTRRKTSRRKCIYFSRRSRADQETLDVTYVRSLVMSKSRPQPPRCYFIIQGVRQVTEERRQRGAPNAEKSDVSILKSSQQLRNS